MVCKSCCRLHSLWRERPHTNQLEAFSPPVLFSLAFFAVQLEVAARQVGWREGSVVGLTATILDDTGWMDGRDKGLGFSLEWGWECSSAVFGLELPGKQFPRFLFFFFFSFRFFFLVPFSFPFPLGSLSLNTWCLPGIYTGPRSMHGHGVWGLLSLGRSRFIYYSLGYHGIDWLWELESRARTGVVARDGVGDIWKASEMR